MSPRCGHSVNSLWFQLGAWFWTGMCEPFLSFVFKGRFLISRDDDKLIRQSKSKECSLFITFLLSNFRNPKNYFAEVEQIAFSPAHFIPGVETSPDKMLQGRLFSYTDTHRHRLGANYQQIPVNCPFNTRVRNYQVDGPQCVTDNHGELLAIYLNFKIRRSDDILQKLEGRDHLHSSYTKISLTRSPMRMKRYDDGVKWTGLRKIEIREMENIFLLCLAFFFFP